MKIEKREHFSPTGTIHIWIVPTVFYLAQKMAGVQHNHLEWLWWIIIPGMFTLWFFINWKIRR
jgi:hypothetical protein